MKDKIYKIFEKHSSELNGAQVIHWINWNKVADEILTEVIGIEIRYIDPLSTPPPVTKEIIEQEKMFRKTEVEKDFLEMFNRIKKSFHDKRGKKFTPTRTVSKPSQLHARLKDYTIEELGKVIYAAFNDPFHAEKNWKFVTTEYVTRTQNLEKYL
jgi:hypothetical protein